MRPSTRRYFLSTITALCLAIGPTFARADVPVIAAASDLKFAVEEIAAAFQAQTGQRVRLAFGSTGNFARQIREGAPFEIFMAADEAFIAELHRDGFTRDAGELYALGRIVLITPGNEALSFESLRDALSQGQIHRFAIANPDHAPYGMRAREALQHAGLWEDILPFLVQGENVSQAASFALSGNADGGIIALSLARAPQVAARGSHVLIPEEYHAPLRQRMALLNGAGPVAEAFYAFIQAPAAREIMVRHGFALPEE